MQYLSFIFHDCKQQWPLLKFAILGSVMLSIGCTNHDMNEDIISTRPRIEEQDTNYIVQTSDGASAETSEHSESDTTDPRVENWCYGDELSEFEFSDDELEMLHLINAYRYQIDPDLPELSILPEASLVARLHSEEMANAEVEFGHDGFEERIEVLTEVLDFHSAAENVGYSQSRFNALSTTFEDWIQSPSHLQNIEGDYEWTGIGVHSEEWIDAEGKTQHEFYVTQIFLY
jgi:uncharacterized protein YkwD